MGFRSQEARLGCPEYALSSHKGCKIIWILGWRTRHRSGLARGSPNPDCTFEPCLRALATSMMVLIIAVIGTL